MGPVLHRDDMAAGKVGALFGRAAARDYIDVAALLLGGHYTREELLRLAEERDGGFDRAIFAQMLAGIARYKNVDFLRYGIDQAFLDAARQEVKAWRRELSGQPADDPSQTERRAAAAQASSPAANALATRPTAPDDTTAAPGDRREPPSSSRHR